MSDLRDVGRMLEAAERAAAAEDFAAADELLKDVARIQEAELGPLHPELANTLNNRAVVAEKTGRLDAAERCYRQAVAIAAASLPVDDPMVAASRENLQDFCRAHGLPIDPPAPTVPVPTALVPTAPVPTVSVTAVPVAAVTVAAADALSVLDTGAAPSDRQHAAPPRLSGSVPKAAIGAALILLVVAVAFFMKSPAPTLAPAPTTISAALQPAEPTPPSSAERTEPALPPAAEPAVPSPAVAAAPAPIEQRQPPAVPRTDARGGASAKPTAPPTAPSGITLIAAQLCQTFSTRGARWTCGQVADPVSRGPIVLYTRVRSPAGAVIVHRWYRGDTLRQSVKLTIGANAAEGYRTYSRQTVDTGEWRVEVRSAEGALLHDQRFIVR